MKNIGLLVYLLAAPPAFAASATTHLLHSPTLNRSQIVLSYAGDLWTVNRSGGTATRLTVGAGIETLPIFSPDGKTLAFTGDYDGNIDVYTMPATGGVPKRITYHPAADYAVGWTPDGQRVLFRSNRQSFSRFTQLFSVSKDGGFAEALPLPMAFTGAYSPDGRRVVYAPLDGGQFGPHAGALGGLEALSGRRGELFVDRESRGSEHGKDPAHGFQRHQSDVGRRQDLFPVGP